MHNLFHTYIPQSLGSLHQPQCKMQTTVATFTEARLSDTKAIRNAIPLATEDDDDAFRGTKDDSDTHPEACLNISPSLAQAKAPVEATSARQDANFAKLPLPRSFFPKNEARTGAPALPVAPPPSDATPARSPSPPHSPLPPPVHPLPASATGFPLEGPLKCYRRTESKRDQKCVWRKVAASAMLLGRKKKGVTFFFFGLPCPRISPSRGASGVATASPPTPGLLRQPLGFGLSLPRPPLFSGLRRLTDRPTAAAPLPVAPPTESPQPARPPPSPLQPPNRTLDDVAIDGSAEFLPGWPVPVLPVNDAHLLEEGTLAAFARAQQKDLDEPLDIGFLAIEALIDLFRPPLLFGLGAIQHAAGEAARQRGPRRQEIRHLSEHCQPGSGRSGPAPLCACVEPG